MTETGKSRSIVAPRTITYRAEEWGSKRELITQLLAPQNGNTHFDVLKVLAAQYDFHPK
jgi:hypothetical protein